MDINKRKHKKQFGQALVEFALIAPIFLLVTVGTIDLAHVIFTYTQAANSLRDATRLSEVIGITPAGVPTYLDCDGMRDAAQVVFWTAAPPTITINYVSHKDSSVTNCDPDLNNVTVNDVETGDMIQIDSAVTIQMLTPVLNAIVPEITYTFQAQRTLFTGLTLGSDDANDTDYDGLDDQWEIDNFGDIDQYTGTDDPDGDGCNVGCEESRDLDPQNPDTDGDGLGDFQEAYLLPTLGNKADTDDDGLTDPQELYGMDEIPGTADDDFGADGIPGTADDVADPGTNPVNPDTDGDGLNDGLEYYGWFVGQPEPGITNPLSKDSDGDLLEDGYEWLETNPCRTWGWDTDTDDDTLSDYDEIFGNPSLGIPAGSDPCDNDEDKDGLTDDEEVLVHGTSPSNPDTDGDGINDFDEVRKTYSDPATDPTRGDTDGDGLSDYDEIFATFGFATIPTDLDTDDDLLYDKQEIDYVCVGGGRPDPTIADTDGDIALDGWEVLQGTDPCTFETGIDTTNPDSDGDGLPDAWEIANFNGDITTQNGTADTDTDGCNEQCEYVNGTNPKVGDSDGDGLSDSQEIYIYNTLPMNVDTDGDGLWDGLEVNTHGTSPKLADTDFDGLSDGDEINIHGTGASTPDTDGDGLNDGDEVNGNNANGYTSSPLSGDTDGDGLTDDDEVLLKGTDPDDTDTDDDTLTDYNEVFGDPDVDDGGHGSGYDSDPALADSDGDGIDDGDEVKGTNGYVTDPMEEDTDTDGLTDYEEIFDYVGDANEQYMVTNPTLVDTDLDGVNDGQEITNGTFPNNPIAILITDIEDELEPSKGGDLKAIQIVISLDKPSPEVTKVNFTIVDGTAERPGDYVCTNYSGTITIPAGNTSATINCDIKGDTNGAKDALTETFLINLSNNVNAFFNNNDQQGKVTISDEDAL